MSINLLITRPATTTLQALKNVSKCCYATKVKGIIAELNVEETPTYETEAKFDQEEINRIRNKSRLSSAHYRILHGQKPYDESIANFHDRVLYKKRLLGKYGIDAPGVPAGICWPSKEDIEVIKEYESLASITDIQASWKEIEQRNKEAAEEIRKREEEIDKVVANFDKWKVALQEKIAKKEAALQAAKEKKERIMREIKEQFGYNIDPRDQRFQEVLEQKEKEDKKRKKEEKKKLRSEKMLAFLAKQATKGNEAVKQSDKDSESNQSKTKPPASEKKVEEDKKTE